MPYSNVSHVVGLCVEFGQFLDPNPSVIVPLEEFFNFVGDSSVDVIFLVESLVSVCSDPCVLIINI